MISYCVACYRPKYAALLLEDLVRKTKVPYEILVWINTPDRSIVETICRLGAAGAPIRIVGDTPHNIGMAAYLELFIQAKYDLIAQLDDDVLRVSPHIPEKCADIFRRHPEVRMLVADVWQDEFTDGNRPPMGQYRIHSEADALWDGPLDSWYGVYHRSIFDILMEAPYDRYVFLGSHVRCVLAGRGQLGVICGKFKVLHSCGPAYAHVFGMFDFELAKYVAVGRDKEVQEYTKAKKPPMEAVLASYEAGVRHVDAFGA